MDLNKINDENDINENVIHFVLTNARSLPPKINSLIDMIHKLDLTFAAVTETWFKGGLKLKQELSDIEQAADIKFVCRNRPGRGAQRGGGVALAFRASVCNFKERKMKKMPFETLCAVGNAGKIKRKLVVFVTYLRLMQDHSNNLMNSLDVKLQRQKSATEIRSLSWRVTSTTRT